MLQKLRSVSAEKLFEPGVKELKINGDMGMLGWAFMRLSSVASSS